MSGSLSQGITLGAGTELGSCRVVREIGRGGMGVVFLGQHLVLQKQVAIKTLPAARGDPRDIERFLQEARIAAKIEHPNVVTIHDAGQRYGVHFIVMQYVDGKTLGQLLAENNGPLPWWIACKIIRSAAKGLGAVHRQGLIHRDIKPSNIMISSEGRVLLMDFGLARGEVDATLTGTGTVVGTLAYMSPEQSRGEPLDRRSDIFSLGGTLYTLLTGQRPYRGDERQVFDAIRSGRAPPKPHQLNAAVPVSLSECVGRAMASRPGDRYPDAESFSKALSNELDHLTRSTTSVPLVGDQPGTGTIELLPELELIANEPISLWRDGSKNYHLGVLAGVVLAALLLLVLMINLAAGFRRMAAPASDANGPANADGKNSAPPQPPKGMVFIPKGDVRMGNSEAELRRHLATFYPDTNDSTTVLGYLTEEPDRRTEVPAFFIDAYEVTNAEFAEFVSHQKWRSPSHWKNGAPVRGEENRPVVNIRHADASAYAAWRGKKLPTKEQWLRAYRGDNSFLFPWGNDYDPSRANVGDNNEFPNLCSVTNTPRDVSSLRVFNLVGNAAEFLRDTTMYDGSLSAVTKGASFATNGYRYGIATSHIYCPPEHSDEKFGFRCVLEISSGNASASR